MITPESTPPSGPKPVVSILVTTYNRSALLRRALGSILQQDFTDFEIVVVDDQSTDDTSEVLASYEDARIRYVRNTENMASKGGDRSIFQRFVDSQARGEFFLWLCDDDYWLPSNLLSRQVDIMRTCPDVVMVFGGMAQLYPTETRLPIPNEPYLSYEYVDDSRKVTFARNVFPNGLIRGEKFLDLFAEDPKNRNNVTGATMFRVSSFHAAGALANGNDVRWQSGYLMLAGTATMGDVWYIDDPCVVATVELESASYRGTQLEHMQDCLRSINAAFKTALTGSDEVKNRRLAFIRLKMMHGIFQTYLSNKISFRLGGFRDNPLRGIERIFTKEIAGSDFHAAVGMYGIPLSPLNRFAIRLATLPSRVLILFDAVVRRALRRPPGWWKMLLRFPAESALEKVAIGAPMNTGVSHA